MNEERLQTLYQNLRDADSDYTRTYQEFVEDMQDENKRRTLHGNLGKIDSKFTRTYEEFSDDMGLPVDNTSERLEEAQQTANAFSQRAEEAKNESDSSFLDKAKHNPLFKFVRANVKYAKNRGEIMRDYSKYAYNYGRNVGKEVGDALLYGDEINIELPETYDSYRSRMAKERPVFTEEDFNHGDFFATDVHDSFMGGVFNLLRLPHRMDFPRFYGKNGNKITDFMNDLSDAAGGDYLRTMQEFYNQEGDRYKDDKGIIDSLLDGEFSKTTGKFTIGVIGNSPNTIATVGLTALGCPPVITAAALASNAAMDEEEEVMNDDSLSDGQKALAILGTFGAEFIFEYLSDVRIKNIIGKGDVNAVRREVTKGLAGAWNRFLKTKPGSAMKKTVNGITKYTGEELSEMATEFTEQTIDIINGKREYYDWKAIGDAGLIAFGSDKPVMGYARIQDTHNRRAITTEINTDRRLGAIAEKYGLKPQEAADLIIANSHGEDMTDTDLQALNEIVKALDDKQEFAYKINELLKSSNVTKEEFGEILKKDNSGQQLSAEEQSLLVKYYDMQAEYFGDALFGEEDKAKQDTQEEPAAQAVPPVEPAPVSEKKEPEKKETTKKPVAQKIDPSLAEIEVDMNGAKTPIKIIGKAVFNDDGTIDFQKSPNLYITDNEGNPFGGGRIEAVHEAVNAYIVGSKQVEAEQVAEQAAQAAEAQQAEVQQAAGQTIQPTEPVQEPVDNRTPEQIAADEAAAAEQAEQQRIDDIYNAIAEQVNQKGGKALSSLTPEQAFIWRWKKKGGSLEAAIERAKTGIAEAEKIKNIDERDYEIEQWQALIDKYAPKEQENEKNPAENLADSNNFSNFAPNSGNNDNSGIQGEGSGDNPQGVQPPAGGTTGVGNQGTNGNGLRDGEGSGTGGLSGNSTPVHVVLDELTELNQTVDDLLTEAGMKFPAPKLRRVDSKTFHQAITEGRKSNPDGWRVDVHSLEEYDDFVCLLLEDGSAGIAVKPDGDIVSLFSNGLHGGVANKLIPMAIEMGGTKADFYMSPDKYNGLQNIYWRLGMTISAQTPFDVDYIESRDDDGNWNNPDWIAYRDENIKTYGSKEGIEKSINHPLAAGYFPASAAEAIAAYKLRQGKTLREEDLKKIPTFESKDGVFGYDLMINHRNEELERSRTRVDLTQPDIVIMRDSHSAYVPCRKMEDGKIVRLDNGKEVKGKTWQEVDKRLVKIGDNSYYLLETLSKENLKRYAKKGGMVKVQPVDNGPQIDMPIADMVWENGERVFVPSEDRVEEQYKVLRRLKREAKSIDEALDYPLYFGQDKEGNPINITLRDLIDMGYYMEERVDEDGNKYMAKSWSGKGTLTKLKEHVLQRLDNNSESGDITGGILSWYNNVAEIWNGVIKREKLNERVEKNNSDFVIAARNSVLKDGKVDLTMPLLKDKDELDKLHNPLDHVRDAKRVIDRLKQSEEKNGITNTGKRKATEEDINRLTELSEKLQDENMSADQIYELADEVRKLRSEVDFGVPEQQQEEQAEQSAQTEEPVQEEQEEPAPAEPAQPAESAPAEPVPASAAPLGETITEEVPAPEKRRGRKKKAEAAEPSTEQTSEQQEEQTPMSQLQSMLEEVKDLKRRMQLGDGTITPTTISEKMDAINDFIEENGSTDEMWGLMAEMQVGDEMELTEQGRRTAEREVEILREAGVEVDLISESQLPNIIGEERMRELRDSKGVVYGMSNGKKIWLIQERMNPNTPVHELGHLWVVSYSQSHPSEWKDAIELLKKTETWQTVLKDDRYSNIHGNEQEMASEVFSRLLGAYYGATDIFGNSRFEESFEKKGMIAKLTSMIRRFLRDTFGMFDYKLTLKDKGFDENVRELLSKPISEIAGLKSDNLKEGNIELSAETQLTEEEQRIKSEAKERGDFMQAPDGTPTSLTEKQWCQVRTEAFKRWAGDSVVLNEHGEPKVVYRGSKNPNSFVLRSKYQSGALWFTDSRAVAEHYARINADHELTPEELAERVQPVFLKMDDAETVDVEGRTYSQAVDTPVYMVEDESSDKNLFFQTREDAESYCEENGISPDEIYESTASGDVADAALEGGNDGVIFKDMIDGKAADGTDVPSTIYVTKSSEQAKSATQNNGEFDGNNPDIRFQIGNAEMLTDENEPLEPAKKLSWFQKKVNAGLDQANGIRLMMKRIGEIEGKKVSMDEDVREALESKRSKIANILERFGIKKSKDLMKALRTVRKSMKKTGLWKKGMNDYYVNSKGVRSERSNLTLINVLEMYLQAKDTLERLSLGKPVRDKELTFRILQYLGMDVNTELKTQEQRNAVLQAMVNKFETTLDEKEVKAMWSAINGCTRFIVDKLHEGGLIGTNEYEELKKSQFYVPERGFAQLESDEDVREKMGYGKTKKRGITPEALKKAEGGESMATDVLANILYLATNAVACAEENKVRQAAFSLLENHSDACRKLGYPAAERVWYVRDGLNEDGAPRYKASLTKPSADIIAQNEEVLELIRGYREDLNLFPDNKAMQEFIKQKIDEAKKDLLIVPKRDAGGAAVSRVALAGEEIPKVLVSVPTEDGDVQQYTMVFPNQPEIANALNGVLNTKFSDSWLKTVGRIFSSLFTTYNPLFWSRNLPRDVLFVLQKGTAERGVGYGAFFAAEMLFRPATTIAPIVAWVSGHELDSKIGREFRQFLDGGGNTGFTQMKGIEEFREEADRIVNGENAAVAGFKFLFGKVPAALNEFSELWTRFAVYRATKASLAMENRMINTFGRSAVDMKRMNEYSAKEMEAMALHDARNFSTNFNRRGAGGFIDFFNSISMFSNASIQGAMTTYRTFEQGEIQKGIRGSMSLMILPALLGYLLTLMSPDDDDKEEGMIPDYIRQNYLVFLDKRIPLSYELVPWYRIGVNYALMQQGKVSKSDGIENIAMGFAEHSLPAPPSISSSLKEMIDMAVPETDFSAKNPNFWQAILPLIYGEFANPFMELSHGKNWTGNNLRYEYAKDTPQWMHQDYEAELYKSISKQIYEWSGGDMDNPSITVDGKKMNDFQNISPKEVKSIIGSVTPNGWVKIACWAWGLHKGNVRDQDTPLKSDFTLGHDAEMARIGISVEMGAMIREAKENYTRIPGLQGMSEKDVKRKMKNWDMLYKDYTEMRLKGDDFTERNVKAYKNRLERKYGIRVEGNTREDLMHAYIVVMTNEEIEAKGLKRTIDDMERWRAKYKNSPTIGVR